MPHARRFSPRPVAFLPFACAAGLCMPAAPAAAQTIDVPPLLPVEKPPITSRYTAVTEREQPGYETSGFDLGGFTLSPSVKVATLYDSNIYAAPTDQKSDVTARIQPELVLRSKALRNSFSIDARGTFDRHASQTSEDVSTYLVTAYDRYVISHATRLETAARAESGVQSRLSEDIAAQTVKPIRYRRQSGVAKLTQTLGHLQVEGTAVVINTDFSDGRLPDGSLYEQRTVSNLDKQARLKATFSPTPSLGIFVQGLYDVRTFRFQTEDTPKRNSTGYQVLAGLVFEPHALMRGSIGIGYVAQNFDNPFYKNLKGVSFDAKVQFFPTQLITVTVSGDRSVKDSGIPTSGGYLSTTATAGVDYELLRQLILSCSIEYQRNKFDNLDRRDTRTTLSPSLSYKLNRYAQVDLSYHRIDQRSAGADRYRPYIDDQATIGLTLRR